MIRMGSTRIIKIAVPSNASKAPPLLDPSGRNLWFLIGLYTGSGAVPGSRRGGMPGLILHQKLSECCLESCLPSSSGLQQDNRKYHSIAMYQAIAAFLRRIWSPGFPNSELTGCAPASAGELHYIRLLCRLYNPHFLNSIITSIDLHHPIQFIS